MTGEALAPVPSLVLIGDPSPRSQLVVSRQTNRQGQTGSVTNTATGWLAQPALARGLVPPGRAVPGGSFTLIFHLILRAGRHTELSTSEKVSSHQRKVLISGLRVKKPEETVPASSPATGARPPSGPRIPETQGQGHRASPSAGPCGAGGTAREAVQRCFSAACLAQALHIEGVEYTGGNSRLNCQPPSPSR